VRSTFLSSAPGRLRGTYDFDIERKVLRRYLTGAIEWHDLTNPTSAEIKRYMSQEAPQLVHISAIDSLQGTLLLAGSTDALAGNFETEVKLIPDGLFFRDNSWIEKIERPRDVAKVVTSGKPKPALVSFNLYNSSARLAAFAVAEGAGAAIGFQDIIDDKLAEIFFVIFYSHWYKTVWNILEAFRKALRGVERYAKRTPGAGIVIWSGTALIGEGCHTQQRSETKQSPLVTIDSACTGKDLEAEVKPSRAPNYSILHNRQSIFEKFNIYRYHPSEIFDLRADVELQLGNERFGHHSIFAMPYHVLDLSNEITIGLTSGMARSLQESIQTTL
jgi:hypothetical protein